MKNNAMTTLMASALIIGLVISSAPMTPNRIPAGK